MLSFVDDSAVIFVVKVVVWYVLNRHLVAKVTKDDAKVFRDGVPAWTEELLDVQEVQEFSDQWDLA